MPLFFPPLHVRSTTPIMNTDGWEREREKSLNRGGFVEWRSMVLHCDWSTSISVLPVAPPPSCDSVSTLRLRENSKTSPAIHQLISICEWGTQLRVLTGKLQCEVTPPEDGNLEHRYRNISSCVGKSDQGKDKVVLASRRTVSPCRQVSSCSFSCWSYCDSPFGRPKEC